MKNELPARYARQAQTHVSHFLRAGLMVFAIPRLGCRFNAAVAPLKAIPNQSISEVFVRKFEVSPADFAAMLRPSHIGNATSLSFSWLQ
jgi:hypothetical protein